MVRKQNKKYTRHILPQCFKILFLFGVILTSTVFVYSKILRGGNRFFADFTLVEGDKRITRNCIANFTKVDLRKCIYKCISNESCLSFNHHESYKICELLDISKFDQLGLLEYHRGWNHYETDYNQMKIGEICKATNLCNKYETCEDTLNDTYYICRCPDGYNGTNCGQYIGRGSTKENPAQACSLILNKYKWLSDGYYWLKTNGASKAAERYCRRKEYLTVLRWSPWNDCVYPGHQERKRECHDPRALNRQERNCEDEYQIRTCFTLPESCNDIIKHNPGSKNGLYKINRRQPIRVYCDMKTKRGGWMLVVNVTIDEEIAEDEAAKITAASSTNIEELYKAGRENFLFDIRYLKNIDTTFKQLRFFCNKKEKRIHIYTLTNSSGTAVVNYFLNKTDKRPQACYSYKRYTGQNYDKSYLTQNCQKWHDQKWGRYTGLVYVAPFHIPSQRYFTLHKYRFQCDDVDKSKKGIWKIYVR